ncbi:MAG: hypothetical protein FWE36_06600 [Erysipelotrichales bacterium]|nr:hypothetical protein [Erysipelotrichales bacterium]
MGDVTELIITGENPYATLKDALWGYGISMGAGAFSNIFKGKTKHVIGIFTQPIVNESVSWLRGDGFHVQDAVFNIIMRAFISNFENPVGQGSLRGVVRSARKRNYMMTQ